MLMRKDMPTRCVYLDRVTCLHAVNECHKSWSHRLMRCGCDAQRLCRMLNCSLLMLDRTTLFLSYVPSYMLGHVSDALHAG
jgi:hypothetical protein